MSVQGISVLTKARGVAFCKLDFEGQEICPLEPQRNKISFSKSLFQAPLKSVGTLQFDSTNCGATQKGFIQWQPRLQNSVSQK